MRALLFAGFFIAAPFVALATAPIANLAAATVSPAPSEDGDPRATLLAAHDRARDAAYGALSQDHRRAVRAVVADADAGTIDRPEAARRIDALLSKNEATAVLGADASFRDAMRAAFAERDGPPGGDGPPRDGGDDAPPRGDDGPPPGGGGSMGSDRGGDGGPRGSGDGRGPRGRVAPDAGRVLLMLGSNRRPGMRGGPNDAPPGASSAP